MMGLLGLKKSVKIDFFLHLLLKIIKRKNIIFATYLGMKNKQHTIDCLRGKNPVRDGIFCQYFVPDGTSD